MFIQLTLCSILGYVDAETKLDVLSSWLIGIDKSESVPSIRHNHRNNVSIE